MLNRLQTWFITQLSCNLAWCIGFLVFSYLEEAYKYPSCFVIKMYVDRRRYKFLVKEDKFVSFSFTAFVNKVLIFFSFAFIFSLLSLLSFFLLSLTFPAAKHTS